MYGALFASKEETQKLLESGVSLRDKQREEELETLKLEIDTIRDHEKAVLTFVANNVKQHAIQAICDVANNLNTPIAITNKELDRNKPFSITTNRLIAHLRKIWAAQMLLEQPLQTKQGNQTLIQAETVVIQEGNTANVNINRS